MKFLFRWAFRLLVLLIVLVVALVLLKDTLVKSLAENRIQAETGLEVRMGKFEVGLMTPTLTIENFVLYNTAEFGGSPFIDLPEIHVEYDRQDLALQKLHLKLVRFHLRELNIVENQQGQTNLAAIFDRLQSSQSEKKKEAKDAGLEFDGIDTLNLSLGKIRYSNLKWPQKSKEFDLDVRNEIVTHVKSQDDLVEAVFRILLRKGVTILTGYVGRSRSPQRLPALEPAKPPPAKAPALAPPRR